jgi:hypothetical protein
LEPSHREQGRWPAAQEQSCGGQTQRRNVVLLLPPSSAPSDRPSVKSTGSLSRHCRRRKPCGALCSLSWGRACVDLVVPSASASGGRGGSQLCRRGKLKVAALEATAASNARLLAVTRTAMWSDAWLCGQTHGHADSARLCGQTHGHADRHTAMRTDTRPCGQTHGHANRHTAMRTVARPCGQSHGHADRRLLLKVSASIGYRSSYGRRLPATRGKQHKTGNKRQAARRRHVSLGAAGQVTAT